jgi:cytochrome c
VTERNIELIRLLLDHGANPNSSVGSQAVLHFAVSRRCLDCVIALVEAGADVNAQTSNGKYLTPLHIAKSLKLPQVLPKPPPISEKLAVADVEKGQLVFELSCGGCHAVIPKSHKMGPSLWGVIGRDKAALAGEKYSETLKGLGWRVDL